MRAICATCVAACAVAACAGKPVAAPAPTSAPIVVIAGDDVEPLFAQDNSTVGDVRPIEPPSDSVAGDGESQTVQVARSNATDVAATPYITDAAVLAREANVPILMYHYVSTPPSKTDKLRVDLSVTPDNFERQLKWLKDNGYATIRLDDLYDHLANATPLPPKPIILTFDDGYRDAYENAFPLLRKYGFVATFFLITDLVNANHPNYLTWPMAREMAAAGMSIESHSRNHVDMRNRSYEGLVWQILGPMEQIEAQTGKRPRFFCYPFGFYDDDAMRVLKSAGTLAALTTQSGRAHTLADAMAWRRVRVGGGTTLRQFAALAGG